MTTPAGPQYPGDFDDVMDGCVARAGALYQAHGVLSHEGEARSLAAFLFARLREQPATPERDALLSVVNQDFRIATYLSCGQQFIVGALARMIRLALPYADREGFRKEWKPA